MKPLFKTSLLFLLSVILITPLLMVSAQFSAQKNVRETLAKQLPPAIESALINAHKRRDLFRLSADRIQQALNRFDFSNATFLPIVQSATIEEFAFNDAEDLLLATSELPRQFSWRQDDRDIIASYRLSFVYDPANLLVQSLVIALIGLGTMKLLPDARKFSKNDWLAKLKSYQFDQREAELISEITEDTPFFNNLLQRLRQEVPLDIIQITQVIESEEAEVLQGETLSWFIIAIKQGLSMDQSFEIATQADRLSFDLDRQELIVHGLTIMFPKTPLFYFYWYAKRKVDNLGPFLNPAQTKPDPIAGAELAAIMDAHRGHFKAIHDLEEPGLKGKTLDQNRNKIKDELTKLLGDELAGRYLFSSERDPKTARYLYELALPASSIRI